MFGTRRLEKFDLQAFRPSRNDSAVVDADGSITESGELPVTRPESTESTEFTEEVTLTEHTIPVDHKTALAEIPTPLVDFKPEAWAAAETPTRRSQDLSPPPATNVDALRTRLTRKFVSLADLVNEAFAGMPLGEGGYTVELTRPKDMSTNGGKLAMELLRLCPRREGYAVVLAGTLNAQRAELREYEYVADWHQKRFKKPLPFTAQTWEEFLRRVEMVLREAGVETVRVQPPRELRPDERQRTRVSKAAIFALVAVLSLAAIACARVAMLLLR